MAYFDQTTTPEFYESPKPFNPGCYTLPEKMIVIFSLIGRAYRGISH